MLLALSVEDLRTYRLPDVLTLPLLIAGLALAGAGGGLPGLAIALLGAAMGYAVIWLLAAYWRWRKGVEGVGLGDAKLLAAGAAWCGPMAIPLLLLMASGSGLAWVLVAWMTGRLPGDDLGQMRLPFGPFLSLAILGKWLTLNWPY